MVVNAKRVFKAAREFSREEVDDYIHYFGRYCEESIIPGVAESFNVIVDTSDLSVTEFDMDFLNQAMDLFDLGLRARMHKFYFVNMPWLLRLTYYAVR